MIEKIYSLVAAEKVLNLLLRDDRAYKYKAAVGTFHQGRECGFSLRYLSEDHKFVTMSISWSEHRSSDGIVVYHGEYASKGLSEQAGDCVKVFAWNEESLAMEYIYQLLEENNAERSE